MSNDATRAEERRQIEAAIAALSAQRGVLGDAVVDLAVAPLRAKLASLEATPPAVAPPQQALRLVTVLFLDVVGSTALSQHLDPEDIHALMDGLLERCTAVVVAQDGKVLQYAGDSLLAVFGADVAREDDAERAVRAGLALLDEGRREGEAVRRKHGHEGFDVRLGAHTGNVLLGGGVDAEGTIRGIAVNIAARLEQMAPVGTLRISRDTYRQVRTLFEVASQPPLDVKGISEPIATYLVLRPLPRAFRLAVQAGEGDGVVAEVGMVGRDREMATIEGLLDDVRRERTARLLTVVADAGMGKTRLLIEVERLLDRRGSDVRVFHGRAQRHGLNVPHGVVRDLFAWHCDILDSDAPAAAADKLKLVFGSQFGARAGEQAALVGQLIGLDFSDDPHIAGILNDGRQIRARAFHAIAEFVRTQCEAVDGFVVLLLDDLHWADDGSLDLVEALATACSDLPVVLACFARPGLLERRPAWGEAIARAQRLPLGPLGVDSSRALLQGLLSRMVDPPPELEALILKSADGNPFHMEELLAMLMDDGVIVRGAEGWRVDPARFDAAHVPATLTAVLQARLDALPSSEKLALQQDSVVGHVFWDEALRQIAPDSIAALDPLARRELISRHEESAFAGVREYAFKHHLLHQVTYDTVLKSAKRDLHKRTADWLVSNTGERIGEHLGLIAEHYERAGDARNATTYLSRAGIAAYAAAAYEAALDYVDRAYALTHEDDLALRCELLGDRLRIYNATGRRKEQGADTAVLEGYAETLGDDRYRARAMRWRSLVALIDGQYGVTLAAADEAHALAVRVGETDEALMALLDKGQALIYTGSLAAAEACLLSILPLASASERPDLECSALNRLNTVLQDRGDYPGARRWLSAAIDVARVTGNRRFEGGLRANLGLLETRIGHHERARALVEDGLAISRAIGDRGSVPYCMHSLGLIAFQLGDLETAVAHCREGAELSRQVGDRGCESECHLLHGFALKELGRFDEALAYIDRYESWAVQAEADRTAATARSVRAELLLAQGRLDEAMSTIEGLLRWLDTREHATDERDDVQRHFACHRVLAAAGAPRAAEMLATASRVLDDLTRSMADDDRAAHLANIRVHSAVMRAAGAAGLRH